MKREARATFGEVAELYDEVRPRYPDRLFKELFDSVQLPPGARILEIGSGTGIATRPLAERGYQIFGVELSTEMAAVARRNLAGFTNVEIYVGAFENWQLPVEPFHLVIAASAFHHLQPVVRYQKPATALIAKGYLAILTGRHVAGGDQAFFQKIQGCYDRYMPGASNFRLAKAEDPNPWAIEIEECGLYEHPTMLTSLSEEVYRRDRYLDLLSTYSDHRLLNESKREALFRCIGSVIDQEFGGRIRKCHVNELIVARKKQ